jgi:hypothetical protein
MDLSVVMLSFTVLAIEGEQLIEEVAIASFGDKLFLNGDT